MTEEEITPTHTCFDDACELLQQIARTKDFTDLIQYRLIHAMVNPMGEPYSHAWVERGSSVITAVLMRGLKTYVVMDKEHFYQKLQVSEVTEYTVQEAWDENRRHGHLGPWKQEYLERCARRRVG